MAPRLNGHWLYLHGFNSGPQSLKARETAEFLARNAPHITLHCPKLAPHPARALQEARSLLERLPDDTLLIGSSLGGFYATWLAETCRRNAVLINPAIRPWLALGDRLGPQHNTYTGDDYLLTEDDLHCLAQHAVATPDPARFRLFLGTADTVLDWREAMRHFPGARFTIFNGDDHRLGRWPECLPALLTT